MPLLIRIQLCLSLVLMFIGCNPEADLLKETSREPNATLRFANFRRTQYKGVGGIKWDLKASEAFIYQVEEKVDRVVVYDFSLDQHDAQDPLFVSAKRGEINYKTGNMTIEGDIYLKDKEGTITSQRMEYNLEKKIADSKDPVTLNRKGLTTECMGGVYYDRSSNRTVCRRPKGSVESFETEPKKDQAQPIQPKSEDLFQ
ncbi:MAG: LPS export ABC transporter periplasmic protein LptC [Leptonema sp. (in: Bacteria)]|nr:LPS export ABC transporter periplasmic protein LptC [Leptonema sp. (in: bacteria)]